MGKRRHKVAWHLGIVAVIMLLLAIPDMLPVKSQVEDEEILALLQDAKKYPDDGSLLAELGIAYHELARLEEIDARLGLQPLKESLQLQYNAYVQSYLGSMYTMVGRDALSPVLKLAYVWRGLWHMDRAVKNSGDSMLPRIIRMQNNSGLPFFFFRSSVVAADLQLLEQAGYSAAD